MIAMSLFCFCFKDFTFPQNFLWFLDWIEKDGEASIEMPNSKVSVQNIHCTTSCQQISICAENTKAISRSQVKIKMDIVIAAKINAGRIDELRPIL